MRANTLDLEIVQGKSFSQVLQWEQGKFVYKAIASASQADPCILGVTGHGMPDGWHFRVVNSTGMTELNVDEATGKGANGKEEYRATVVDPNTIELNDVAAAGFKPYRGGGSIVYREPQDLTGYTARMMVREHEEASTAILELTNANGGIVLNNTTKTITIVVTDTQSALLTPGTYYYDLEVESAGGDTKELVHGTITVEREITR